MAKRKWGVWVEYFNAKKGKYYYYNTETKKSTYDMPEGFNEHAKTEEDAPPAKRKKVASTGNQASSASASTSTGNQASSASASASSSTWSQGYSKKKKINFWYNYGTKTYAYSEPDGWKAPAIQPNDVRQLMVSGFTPETTKDELYAALGKRGEIVRFDIVEKRGFGFVVYKDEKVALNFAREESFTIGDETNGTEQELVVSQVVENLQSASGLGAPIRDGWGAVNNKSTWGKTQDRAPSGGRGGYGRRY